MSKSVTTRYVWEFAKNITDEDKDRIESIHAIAKTVPRDLASTSSSIPHGLSSRQSEAANVDASASARRAVPQGPPKPEFDVYEEEERAERERLQRKRERREHKATEQLILDELAPRETGRQAVTANRDAKIAAKRAQNAYYRRNEGPADVEIDPNDIAEDTSFGSMLKSRQHGSRHREERRERARAEREAATKEKMAIYKEKERNTLEMLRKMAEQSQKHGMGIQPRGNSNN
ncbi:hypothetical protein EV182_002099 [Spiromyces aspiralis]|uniref:Uncharacterized protein n=1 Tax=Spiromyces aspiralis TaxID=68401 RepID=A0ACC1HS76_9FUNG|nr:hypothetical protein EV182_002099 [Spiromyces aspiralis]